MDWWLFGIIVVVVSAYGLGWYIKKHLFGVPSSAASDPDAGMHHGGQDDAVASFEVSIEPVGFDRWSGPDEEKYRELQSIWLQALDYVGEKRHGIAIRLFQEGIQKAERPEYANTHRLEKLKRDLADALADLKEYGRALELFTELEAHASAGDVLLHMGDYDGAIAAYQQASTGEYNYEYRVAALHFGAGRDEEGFDALERMTRDIPLKSAPTCLNKTQTMIALVGMRSRHGEEALHTERAEIEQRYKKLYRAIVRRHGNWKSALIHLREDGTEAKLAKIRQRARRPRPRPNIPPENMMYDEAEVSAALQKAGSSGTAMQSLQEGCRLVRAGDLEGARSFVLRSASGQTGLAKSYVTDFVRSTYLLENRFAEALDYETEDLRNNRWNIYLNLLLLAGRPLTGALLATRFRWSIEPSTPFLDDHPDELAAYCQHRLDEFAQENGAPLLQWIAQQHPELANEPWSFFLGGSLDSEVLSRFPFARFVDTQINFYDAKPFTSALKRLLEDAENRIREGMGLPRIGEGWVAETEMVNLLREKLAPNDVIPQGSPPWLGQQRFDAFVPSLRLAVEYQGIQHYQPVEIFGGDEGLQATQGRDRRKAELAAANGVRLEYIRHDENTKERVEEIVARYSR